MTEDEMVGWYHLLNGQESEQTLGDSEGQGSLACCNSWSPKGSDMTEQLNNNNNHTVDPVYLFCPPPTPLPLRVCFLFDLFIYFGFFACFVILDSSHE